MTRSAIDRVRRRHRGTFEGMAKGGWLNFIQATVGLARINVKSRRWRLLDAPKGLEFVTNDLGVVKSLVGWHEPANWEPGTLLGRSFWLVPLSPRRALAIEPTEASDTPRATPEVVRAINRQMLLDARRYVFSRSALLRTSFVDIPPDPGEPDASHVWSRLRR